jgi:hypothetical protein
MCTCTMFDQDNAFILVVARIIVYEKEHGSGGPTQRHGQYLLSTTVHTPDLASPWRCIDR